MEKTGMILGKKYMTVVCLNLRSNIALLEVFWGKT